MRSFNPGDYRHKIDFLQQSTTQNEYGENVDTWTTYKTVYASKEPILGNEFFSALTTDSKVEIKFNTRYISGITNAMRIKSGDDVYEILSAIDVRSMKKELLCYCIKL